MKKKKRKIAASIETAILVEEGGFEPPKRYATDLQFVLTCYLCFAPQALDHITRDGTQTVPKRFFVV
ncbi:hypothetical protein AAEU42_13245 [Pseudoflavonifractor phocaeensis]|uniref:hypothetical protein n=1 Tax=Pseudoflavonifractor phocaeensis TaxID=1870988 RepID=UPI00313ADE71